MKKKQRIYRPEVTISYPSGRTEVIYAAAQSTNGDHFTRNVEHAVSFQSKVDAFIHARRLESIAYSLIGDDDFTVSRHIATVSHCSNVVQSTPKS